MRGEYNTSLTGKTVRVTGLPVRGGDGITYPAFETVVLHTVFDRDETVLAVHVQSPGEYQVDVFEGFEVIAEVGDGVDQHHAEV